jgi:hypothetical protein
MSRSWKRQIPVGPDIGTTQSHQQVDVRSPGANPWNLQQPRARRLIIEVAELPEIQLTIHNGDGQVSTVSCLLTGEAISPETGLADPGNTGWNYETRSCLQPFVGCSSGGKRYLLLEDDANQRRKPRAAGPERRRTEALNHPGDVGVPGTQFLDPLKQRDRGEWGTPCYQKESPELWGSDQMPESIGRRPSCPGSAG